jgi:hypothetical protein
MLPRGPLLSAILVNGNGEPFAVPQESDDGRGVALGAVHPLMLVDKNGRGVDLATLFGGVPPVSSVFGRTGAVVAAAGDYDASEVGNDSDAPGSSIADVLNYLLEAPFTSARDPRFGIVGDGVADDTAAIQALLDYCFGPAGSPHGTNSRLNKQCYFPPGIYKVTAKLTLTRIRGGRIFGAGRFATRIVTTSTTEPIFETNGFEYSFVHGMELRGVSTTPRLLDLSWDNGAGPALQSNTFFDLYFDTAVIGIDIGRGGFMGSENHFIQVFVANCTTAGIKTSNFNALQQGMWGGNIAGCAIGIWVASGSFPTVIGTGFQNGTGVDFKQVNTARDTVELIGCRTESLSFYSATGNPITASLRGCSQLNATLGNFAEGGGKTTVVNCDSQNGTCNLHAGIVENSIFGATNPFPAGFFGATSYLEVRRCNIGSGPTRIERRRYEFVSAGVGMAYDWTDRVNEFTGSGDITLAGERTVLVNKAAGAATAIILGTAAARNMLPITVKDLKGDAAANNITFTVSGGELVDGLAASNFTIDENYGSLTLYPKRGGGAWYTLQ